MRKTALIAAVLLASAACSKKAQQNYKTCLKLRVGMTGAELLAAMGQPDETQPYVEGKSLPHMKGKTAHEWATPSSMAAPVRVVMVDAEGKVESIRCGDVQVTAAVFVEPPAPVEPAPSTTTVVPVRPQGIIRERGASNSRASGKPLTE